MENFNRRSFIKSGIAAGIPAFAISNSKIFGNMFNTEPSRLEDYPEFFNLFKKTQETQFPISFSIHNPSYNFDQNSKIVQRNLSDYIYLEDSRPSASDELNKDAAELIIASAIDRNMVVYNNNIKYPEHKNTYLYGKICPRLQQLINTVQYEYSKTEITDIFVKKSKAPDEYYRIICNKWHLVPDKIWDQIEDLYHNKYGATLVNHKNNLLICVNRNNQDFVYSKNRLAVLSNKNLLLGCF